MRLLNCDTGQLEEFFNANAPSYTILSHTWGKQEEEVNYQDMCSPETADPARKKGYNKLVQCCDQTLRMGKTYTWIDTCSINKSSSAELSEAINSMYKWYRDADICFVYLADVHVTQRDQSFEASFIKSRWFSRGWTLQELIAPRQLLFFNAAWTSIGTKATLLSFISRATGIDKNTLLNPELSSLSIARKMSWASKRQTTRSEDIAYCLLGIFDINMPLLYGEGDKAFIRLQEEILKGTDDHSIFAWGAEEQNPESPKTGTGILAKHPSLFHCAATIEPHPTQGGPYSITNKGVQIRLPLLATQNPGEFLAVLGCHEENDLRGSIGLFLLEIDKEEKQYVRFHQDIRFLTVEQSAGAKHRTIFISRRDTAQTINRPIEMCWIRRHPDSLTVNRNIRVATVFPIAAWNMKHKTMKIPMDPSYTWSKHEAIITYVTEIDLGTETDAEADTEEIRGLASFNEDAELAFAVTLQLQPMDHSATVGLHLLPNRSKAMDLTFLESEFLADSETLADSTTDSATATLLWRHIVVIARISVETVRGRHTFVLDLDIKRKIDWTGHLERRLLVSLPHRLPVESKGPKAASSSDSEASV
jgi:hypothetical protein